MNKINAISDCKGVAGAGNHSIISLLCIKLFIFLLIFCLLFLGVNYVVQPVWLEWNNYNTTYGFYDEPENTIETIFLGASITINGVTPMELYEDYGICAYNLGTEQQPMLASYYWLEEAYRLHSENLKTVMLDVSMLRRTPEDSFYRKALDAMEVSSVKYNATKDFTGNTKEALLYLFPIYSYHTRWNSLNEIDFQKTDYEIADYLRGYNFAATRYFDLLEWDNLSIPTYCMEAATETELNEESLYYLKKMIDFCASNDIKLVLMKTPVISSWSFSDHNAVASIAERYQLDFLDFNYEPLLDEIGYNHALDSADGGHLNYYGASKLTSYLGNYLIEQCDGTDVRGRTEYSYLDTQLEKYKKKIKTMVEMYNMVEPSDYISTAVKFGYTVFITAKDEASQALTEEQRSAFANMGLAELSQLTFRDSYLAVIEDGEIICEESDYQAEEEQEELKEQKEAGEELYVNDLESATLKRSQKSQDNLEDVESDEELAISIEGMLQDGTKYKVVSGGAFYGNISSCLIDEVEYSQNWRGLNIIIYDEERHQVIDSVNFDTYSSSQRESRNVEQALNDMQSQGAYYAELSGDVKKLWLYNRRCEDAKYVAEVSQGIGEDGLFDFLDAYWDKPDTMIFISAKDEAATTFNEAARAAFGMLGLSELALLENRDSYLAVIENGQVLYERKDHGAEPISWTGREYIVKSGGFDSGNCSSIKIAGVEYSLGARGLNIVVLDTQTNEVIDRNCFDTYAVPSNISAEWFAR